LLDLLKGDIYIYIYGSPQRRPLLTGDIYAGLLKGDIMVVSSQET